MRVRCSRLRLAAEKQGVTKSPYIIGGIGLIGCLSLGFAMRQLADAGSDRDQSPLAADIETFLGPRLRGRLAVRERADGQQVVLTIRAVVESGLDLQETATQVGEFAWRSGREAGVALAGVEVALQDGERAPLSCSVAEPARRR